VHYVWDSTRRHLANTTEQSVLGGMRTVDMATRLHSEEKQSNLLIRVELATVESALPHYTAVTSSVVKKN